MRPRRRHTMVVLSSDDEDFGGSDDSWSVRTPKRCRARPGDTNSTIVSHGGRSRRSLRHNRAPPLIERVVISSDSDEEMEETQKRPLAASYAEMEEAAADRDLPKHPRAQPSGDQKTVDGARNNSLLQGTGLSSRPAERLWLAHVAGVFQRSLQVLPPDICVCDFQMSF
ncbi:MAG: hypothetical protein M1812_000004 [Candelaria pacifica]|nr:MAG: hypothetical protein M1812_000004 [Candelaria pacifica]